MLKIAPEGYPFVAVCAGLTALLAILTAFMIYFFRDPERACPDREDAFVSPADGRVMFVKDVVEPKYLKEKRKHIAIFMSPFNVHVNRSPCRGTVCVSRHNTGRYFAAYREDADLRNENHELVLDTPHGQILVRQIAGFIARRTVCRVGPGATLRQGERFGMIKFSSRVDLFVPPECTIAVKPGDHVRAGETILAVMPEKS